MAIGKRSLHLALLVYLVGNGCNVGAYDTPTHALITYKAYQRSVLKPSDPNSIVHVLMFDRLDSGIPFAVNYLDNQATSDDPTLYTRQAQEQERAVFRSLIDAGRIPDAFSVNSLEYRVDGWLMDGAVREDDVDFKIGPFWTNLDDRDQDPWGYLFRSSRHFYDPIYDRPFDYPGPCVDYGCVSSPQWALGTLHPLSPPSDAEDTGRRNHFTWIDARNNYWSAITKERYPNGGTSADRYNSSLEREQRWSSAIKSIGHVLHLLEDGAQPQHVRNDAHAPPPVDYGLNYNTGGAYEDFTDYRVTGVANTGWIGALRYMDESLPPPGQIPALVFDGYPIPTFATPAEYFSTRYYDNGTDVAGINARRGMQDFANRNFFTAGTYPGFEQCNPPGTTPCSMRDPSATYVLPENDLTNAAVYTQIQSPNTFRLNGYVVKTTLFARKTVDPLNPNFDNQVLPSQFGGMTPIVSRGTFFNDGPSVPLGATTGMNYDNFVYDANVLLPRAVGYAAGMINYFFRGRLAVTAPSNLVVGVLNQGGQHTMNAQGYPCVGAATNDGCSIFGFQTVRVSVQNVTPQITESGSGTAVPQKLSATNSGSINLVNPPYLVAVARYHRNTCYKPDLSGERVEGFSGSITEPSCSGGQTVRTPYQEISVSKSFAATAAQLAPGAAAFDIQFDFSGDPIPVNATDLFIQVVYRGPMGDATLGQELDAIAIGTLDVREPAFAAFWNNTDYWWNTGLGGPNWVLHNGTNVNEGVQSFWVCSGFPLRLMFRYDGTTGSPAMIDPVTNSNTPGMVRLGFIFPPPTFTGQQKTVQGTAVAFAGFPKIPVEQQGTPGQFRQANLESVSAATLSAPTGTCNASLPTTPEYWCFDPIQKRRGQLFGAVAAPLYLPDGSGGGATDVDSVPLPTFTGTVPLSSGTVRFDTDATLVACPARP